MLCQLWHQPEYGTLILLLQMHYSEQQRQLAVFINYLQCFTNCAVFSGILPADCLALFLSGYHSHNEGGIVVSCVCLTVFVCPFVCLFVNMITPEPL